MLRHVNVFTWKEGVTQADVDALGTELERMGKEIPEVRALSFGPDLNLVDGNCDFAVLEEFDGRDAFRRYAAHAAHDRMVGEFLRPMLANRYAVQFETE